MQLHASCTDTFLQMEVGGVNRKGETVKDSDFDSSGEEGELSMKGNSQYQQSKQSAKAAELKADNELCPEDANGVDSSPLFYVERSELCRWNDNSYIESYRRSLSQAVEAVRNGDLEEESESEDESSGSEMEEDLANCLVLDMTHGLSPFGLIAAREGMYM